MSRPMASVVICCYHERRWDDIVEAVQSIGAQTVAPAEVLLVVDHNPRLYDRARAAFDGVRVVPNARRQGLSGSRNTGVDLARGEIVAFLDDDAAADPDWLAGLLEPYADPDVVAVGGRALPVWPADRPPATLPPELYWIVGCGFTGQPSRLAEVRNLMGCAMSFRRDAVLRAGGFAEQLGRVAAVPLGCEETELCIRLRQREPRAKVLLQPAATVRHRVTAERTSRRYLRRRSFAEGLSKAAISRLVGRRDALSTERSYLTSVIPRALWRELRRGRGAAAGGILLAVSATCAGYLAGLRRATPMAETKPEPVAPPLPAKLPAISVVLATAGDPALAARCVHSVLNTGYPALEVVLIDNHRSGPAGALVELAATDRRIRYLREPTPGASRARNLGARHATGTLLAFTDDDAIVDTSWLAELAAELSQPDTDCVTGLVVPASLDTPARVWFEEFGGFGKGYVRRVYTREQPGTDPLYPLSPGIFGSGNNMAWRREKFLAIGGFDERLGPGRRTRAGEDLDLFVRLITGGGRLTYTPHAVVRHEHRATVAELRDQLRGYGTGLASMFLVHATRPGGLAGIATRLPRGVARLLAPGSARNSGRSKNFPRRLVLDELRGMVAAPAAVLLETVERRR